jgi:bifunctional DNA-binding transcriptional regulator/antitoxin component of YhaV-PrlF toxin-antitoxin module
MKAVLVLARERIMESQTIVMDESGRLTVPEEVRRALGLTGVTTFDLDVDAEGGVLLLRSATKREPGERDFTPEQLESVARGLKDSREGRVRRLSEKDLLKLGGLAEADA